MEPRIFHLTSLVQWDKLKLVKSCMKTQIVEVIQQMGEVRGMMLLPPTPRQRIMHQASNMTFFLSLELELQEQLQEQQQMFYLKKKNQNLNQL